MKDKESNRLFVGKCIYCRSAREPLQDEHIIPYGLEGKLILLKASCKECADITSRFEREVLRGPLLPIRAELGFSTYHKKNRPTLFPLLIERGGKKETLMVPIEEYFSAVILPEFKLPEDIDERPHEKGIAFIATSMGYAGKKPIKELARKYNATSFFAKATYTHAFPRFLAKMAYGFAVAKVGLNKMQKIYVLPAILGKSEDIGRWVGCSHFNEHRTPGRFMHSLRLSLVNNKIWVYVRLFEKFNMPEYLVIVGTV
ncbi:MAG TPA: hypothetical protein ENI23_10115 [bacterium]|nr:hypothetical protein [bacterium]